jgi:hypothetical protein
MLTVFSIGLNVRDHEPRGQLSRTLHAATRITNPHNLAIGRSEWQGVPERFVQIAADEIGAKYIAALLADCLDQDAVAYLPPDADRWMIVNPQGVETPGGTLAEFPCIVSREEIGQ